MMGLTVIIDVDWAFVAMCFTVVVFIFEVMRSICERIGRRVSLHSQHLLSTQPPNSTAHDLACKSLRGFILTSSLLETLNPCQDTLIRPSNCLSLCLGEAG
jgi:hypothetical protein